jgi:hypothetical protein
MGAQSHLDTERNRYLRRIYCSIFTNTTLFSSEVVHNEGFSIPSCVCHSYSKQS